MILSDNADGVIGVEDVINLTDMFLPLENLEKVCLPQGVEKDTVSVVELVDLAFFDCNYLCAGLVFLQRVLSVILREYFLQLG